MDYASHSCIFKRCILTVSSQGQLGALEITVTIIMKQEILFTE